MRKLLFALAVILFNVSCLSAEERVIDQSKLPANAQTFISTYYSSDKVAIATEERDLFDKDYKVILTSGIKIEFDDKGNWTDVECKGNTEVPKDIVPDYVSQYVKANFPSNIIIQIDRDKKFVEVELNNKVELKFNNKGVLVEFDN
ncbi:MAG: PepSY-like domain-containing protein [Rikenellaceae bacterium]